MRFPFFIAFAAFALAGCNPADRTFVRDGAGVTIYSPDQATRTLQEDAYLGLMCDAAGLPVLQDGDFRYCPALGTNDARWTLVTQAALNDIDARCDAYVSWLSDRKRSREPILAQLAATQSATATILSLSNAGQATMGVVAAAFGLATKSFENYTSRLIFEVNHETVTAVVRDKQKTFRESIRSTSITNRPNSVHVIRSYLRICMPDTIENSINSAVVLASVGGLDAVAAAAERAKEPPVTVSNATLANARTPIAKVAPLSKPASGFSRGEVKRVQLNLGLPRQDGVLDQGTQTSFDAYLRGALPGIEPHKGGAYTRAEHDCLMGAPSTPCTH